MITPEMLAKYGQSQMNHVAGKKDDAGKHDPVNSPSHYQLFPGQEAIDIIKAALTPEEFAGYCKGNCLKYRLRAGKKDDLAQDIAKADWYRNQLFDQEKPLMDWRELPEDYSWVKTGFVGETKGPDTLANQAAQCAPSGTPIEWPASEQRMDIVGQNGNTGEHYEWRG